MKKAGLLIIVLGMLSCRGELGFSKNPFVYGVASGDPFSSSIVLWTKLKLNHESTDEIYVSLHLSTSSDNLDKEYSKIKATKDDDFTVKTIVNNLRPNSVYYYRFSVGSNYSRIGRAKTLPVESDTVKLAFVSCGHYETGYFNVYEAISKMEDIDAVVHLGDYIYEGALEFNDSPRIHNPEKDCLTLDDYRTRYAQYRLDSSLQALHSKHSVINIWDDHEIADNWTPSGSHTHNSKKDGTWFERKRNAQKAFFEWIPIRAELGGELYRKFDFGKNASLLLLDTRSYRTGIALSDEQADTLKLLGTNQWDWLKSSLLESSAPWKIIGNQVAVSKMDYYSFYPEWKKSAYDKWYKGYPNDFEKLVSLLKVQNEEVLIATGDIHSAFLNNLIDGNDTIAKEIITTSVSSHTWDEDFEGKYVDNKSMLKWVEEKLQSNNPHIEWFNLVDNGFLLLSISEKEAVAKWYAVSTQSKDYSISLCHKKTFRAK